MLIRKQTVENWGLLLASVTILLIAASHYLAFDIALDAQQQLVSDVLEGEGQPRASDEMVPGRGAHPTLNKSPASDLAHRFLYSGMVISLIAATLVLMAMWAISRRIQPVFEHLKESEVRYRTMVASMDEGVVMIDEHGMILSSNLAVKRLFGYREEELLGKNVKILMPRAYSERHDEYLSNYLETGEKHIIGVGREVHGRRRDGSEFPIQLFVSEMNLAGRHLFTGIMHDISVRKEAEAEVIEASARAEKAAAAKSEFLANMSHEIRTPMNGVLGMLELLSASKLKPTERDYVQMARQSAVSLLGLIDDILDLSKIEAGRIELEYELSDLHELVEDAAGIGASLALEKDLQLNCYIAPDVPARVPADSARLRQVLLNLLSNAIKFTERGEVNLLARLDNTDDDGVTIRFTVEDSGIGIEPENLHKLFEPFVQADSSITKRFGGTGLGLTISQHLVHLMGGEIVAQSTPGTGSVFSFTTRLGTPVVEEHGAIEPGPKQLRVLLVDSNETASRFLRNYLHEMGAEHVEEARNVQQAQRLIQPDLKAERPHDLIMIETSLNGVSDVVNAIRSAQPNGRTRLVALNPVDVPRRSIQRLAFDAALVSPVRRADLKRLLSGMAALPDVKSESEKRLGDAKCKSFRDARVLLAEDNPVNQAVCVKMLERFAIKLEVVDNGQQAVARLHQQQFDLVLMDCQMPVMDGYTAAGLIRDGERTMERDKTPIVAVTAMAMEGDRDKCLAAGMNDYISKPYRLAEIETLLHRWLPRNMK